MSDSSSPPRGRALRTAALYTLLVGAPALGVGATLHVGQGLVAPPAVGGAWRVEPAEGGCRRAAGTLRIAQSGARVDGVYAPAEARVVTFRGRVGEDRAVLGERARCERVEVAVTRDPVRPDTLRATVRTGACGCRTTEALLVRSPTEPLGGGH